MAAEVDSLPVDTYKVRWALNVPGLAEIKEPGQQIKVTDTLATKDVTINGHSVTIKGLAMTLGGPVPFLYLEPKFKKASKLEQQIYDGNPVSEEVANGQWWVGRMSPVEVGIRLARDPGLIMGSYAVCQPPEMEPMESGEWAEFVLVVRNVSGNVDQWMYEWDLSNKYNQKFGKRFKERDIGNDIIKGPPTSPIPPVAYYTIKRTQHGKFFLIQDDTFRSIDLLLSHYYTHLLPLKGEKDAAKQPFPLFLQGTSRFDNLPHTIPKPVLGDISKPEYLNKERSPIRLIVGTPMKALEQYKPRIAKKIMFQDQEQRESLFKAYFFYNGSYKPVTLRKLRPKLFNNKAFENNIKRLISIEEKSKADQKGCHRNGSTFLSHLVAYGHHDEVKFANWIAYEFINGTPLDRCLQRRKYLNQFMSLRQKSEILYQVSAGMRFLELNDLCHRHLRASNIVVHQSTNHIYAVKITDYLVPYHFLDKDTVEMINMCDLDWPWWAPECLEDHCFDIVTDIWAFGCVIFEINHDGLGPYAFQQKRPQSHNDLQAIFERKEKMVIVQEDETDTFLDELLFMCVNYEPEARPTFDYLFNFFRALLFDFAVGPDPAIQKYIKKPPKKFNHSQRAKQ
ncbi:Protein kinase domain-containing protein [Trichostrongylus colubriformis]|uniref:Protein kinase domain-containing protein n=1 Tax=Trichostrongylus colubriformis TaxID=6319 RepID=A0AAN8F1R8_TRICO